MRKCETGYEGPADFLVENIESIRELDAQTISERHGPMYGKMLKELQDSSSAARAASRLGMQDDFIRILRQKLRSKI